MAQTATNPTPSNTPPPIDLSEFGAKPIAAAPAGPANQPVDLSEFGAKPVQRGATGTAPKQPSAWQVLTQPTEKTDKEYLGYTGPAGVVGATVHGLSDVARATVGAAKGAVSMFDPRTQPGEDVFTKMPIIRALRPFVNAAKQIPQIPAAVHDINQSDDPTGAYLNAAQDTASQGAGQALTALATEGALKGAPETAALVKRTVPPLVRGVAKGTNTVLAKAPGSIGMAAGATVGHYIPIPGATTLGGAIGYALGKELLPTLRVPGENFGLPQAVDPGAPLPASPPTGEFVEPAEAEAQAQPPVAPAEVVPPKLLPATASGVSRRVPGQVAPEEVGAPDASTLAGRKGIRIVLPGEPKQLTAAPEEVQPAAAATETQPVAAAATAPATVTPSKIVDLLGRSLGNEPAPKPVPGKPIYSRPGASAQAPLVPEGMTPVKSSGVRAYSYDAPSQTFTAQWPDGSLHKYGEVTPEEVNAFETADSKGRALLKIKNDHVHLAANYGKGWVNKAAAVRSAAPAETAPAVGTEPATGAPPAESTAPDEDLTPQLEASVKQAESRKAAQAAAPEDEQGRPFAGPESSTTYGTRNRVVSLEEADQARANLQSKMFRSNAGLDPTMLADAAKLGAYHLEAGLREFGAWSAKMVDELGDKIKPHLEALWSQVRGDSPNAPTFYSKAAQVVNDKVGGAGSGDQILATLRNNGVKENEIGWMGLDDFLKGKPKVSKADLQQFIHDNQIQLEETTRGTQREQLQRQRDAAYAAQNRMWEDMRYDWGDGPTIGSWLRSSDEAKAQAIQSGAVTPEKLAQFQKFDDLGKQIADLDMKKATLQEKPVKYESYTLPGDKSNYSEMLMRLQNPPQNPEWTRVYNEREAVAKQLSDWVNGRDAANPEGTNLEFGTPEYDAAKQHYDDLQERFMSLDRQLPALDRRIPQFHSSHFDDPNILAHVRFDDRVAADGKPTLFLEEVQSDWHQQGKKIGYRTENAQAANQAFEQYRQSLQDKYGTPAFWNQVSPEERAQYGRLVEQADAETAHKTVPDAPFKSDWHELAMKRMLRYAAENGYDRIAWTTGAQQAARYDLSKQISSVAYSGTNLKAFDMDGNQVISRTGVTRDDLADYIGKDAAQKLLAEEPQGTLRTLSGLDLKTGGDWAKALYDRAIPNFLNKYTKKWGAKVGDIVLPNATNVDERFDLTEGPGGWRLVDKSQNEGRGTFVGPIFKTGGAAEKWLEEQGYLDQKVHSLDITPVMKKSVLREGQPISRNQNPAEETPEMELATA